MNISGYARERAKERERGRGVAAFGFLLVGSDNRYLKVGNCLS